MDEVDDFGDLYADLDDNFSAATAVYCFGIDKKLKDLDSIDEEHSLNGGIDDANGAVDLGDGIMDSGENSESEDDLHIVLNGDEDSRLSHGNGGMIVRRNGEEDDEELVILDGSDPVNKDQRWSDQLLSSVNGLVQGRMERSNFSNGDCRGWRAGPHPVAFPCNSRTPLSGQGDWNQSMVQYKGGISCNAGISVAAQKGFSFFLPRNRTIFDINIEALEKKPWRESGVDMTDYFNFGLEEESWKSYCQQLDHIRQQAMMLTQFPGDESSTMDQVSTYLLKSIKSSETGQFGLGERTSSAMENEEKGLKRLEKPKGRAIQVENGIGERVPSMDIRRPRERDSDVVIHINIEEFVNSPSTPNSVEPEHAELDDFNCSAVKYENGSAERIPLVEHGNKCGKDTSLTVHDYPKQWESDLKGAASNAEAKLEPRRDSSRANSRVLEAGSASGDFLVDGSCQSDLDGPSRELMDENYLKRVQCSVKEKSLEQITDFQESVTSDCNLSNCSRDNADKAEQESKRSDGYYCALSPGDHSGSCLTRPLSRDELCNARKDEKASIHAFGTCRNDMNPIKVKRTKEKLYKDSCDAGGLVSSDKRTKRTPNIKRKIYAEEHRNKISTRRSQSNAGYIMFSKQEWEQKDWLLDQEDPSRITKSKHEDHYFLEHDDDCQSYAVSCENVDEPIAECGSFVENDLHPWHKNVGHHLKMEDVPAENIDEYRYGEVYVQEKHGQLISSCNWEDKIFDRKAYRARELRSSERDGYGARELRSSERDGYGARELRGSERDGYGAGELRSSKRGGYGARELRSSERGGYGHRSNGRAENSENIVRYLDHRFLDSPRDHILDERRQVDASMSRQQSTWKSSERYVDYRRLPNAGEIQSKNKNYKHSFVQSRGNHSYSEDEFELETQVGIFGERNVRGDALVENRKCDWLAKKNFYVDEKVLFEDFSSPILSHRERRSSNEADKLGFVRSINLYDDQLDNARKEISKEGRIDRYGRRYCNFVSNIFDEKRHDFSALERKEAVNIHLNGWKRKFPGEARSIKARSGKDKSQTALDKELMHSRHKEAIPRMSSLERSYTYPAKLKVEKMKISRLDDIKNPFQKKILHDNPVLRVHEDDEIEEGQLIEEPEGEDAISVLKGHSPTKEVCSKEKNLHSKDSTSKNGIDGGCDNNRILEMLAKMEKRRERFKDPIALKNGPEESDKESLDIPATIAIDEVKKQRPARKRRWGSS
ncbi:uncharacterized protein [Typha latifolia]|uniref:uncharacterized protein isoform X1 n=2 Tax=Typha latifolia TaxID=4733 RepID=UPI003C2D4802